MGLLGLRLLPQPFFMPIVSIVTCAVEVEPLSPSAYGYLIKVSKC